MSPRAHCKDALRLFGFRPFGFGFRLCEARKMVTRPYTRTYTVTLNTIYRCNTVVLNQGNLRRTLERDGQNNYSANLHADFEVTFASAIVRELTTVPSLPSLPRVLHVSNHHPFADDALMSFRTTGSGTQYAYKSGLSPSIWKKYINYDFLPIPLVTYA